MGLFDRFRKPKPSVPLPQLCYDVAYFILPQYAFNHLDRIVDLCSTTPNAAGPFFYIMACQMRKVEPIIDDAKMFHWHYGKLCSGQEYYALEYPALPAVDFSTLSPEEIINADPPLVLAPYFSAISGAIPEGEVGYHVLGQTSVGHGTTLRSVLRDGMNCNLGPGPEPRLEAFLDVLSRRAASEA